MLNGNNDLIYISVTDCFFGQIINFLGVAKIPDHYILKCWTKDARDVLPENLRYLQKDNRSMKSHTFRDSLLYGKAMKAVQLGNNDMETFTEMMKHFRNGMKVFNDIIASRGETVTEETEPCYVSSDNEWHRGQLAGYQSEPDLGLNGKQIYSHARFGAAKAILIC
jgi:hypothetical protein